MGFPSQECWNGVPLPSTVTAAAAAAKSLRLCPTLCNPIDGSPPGSPVPGILQARILEWVAISFSKVKSESEVTQSHGLQPTRLLHPWDFPGKSAGMGCHCLLHSLCYTTQISHNYTHTPSVSSLPPLSASHPSRFSQSTRDSLPVLHRNFSSAIHGPSVKSTSSHLLPKKPSGLRQQPCTLLMVSWASVLGWALSLLSWLCSLDCACGGRAGQLGAGGSRMASAGGLVSALCVFSPCRGAQALF